MRKFIRERFRERYVKRIRRSRWSFTKTLENGEIAAFFHFTSCFSALSFLTTHWSDSQIQPPLHYVKSTPLPLFSQWRPWLMSPKPKRTALSDIRYTIYDIRCTVSVFVCEAGRVFCEILGGGVPPGYWNSPYLRHMPIELTLWESDPRALKCFVINRNYLMLLRMRCFVYFRSGRILFAM